MKCPHCNDEPDPTTTCQVCGRVGPQTIPWQDPDIEMLALPEFDAVFRVIKGWDIAVPGAYAGYESATGNHVKAILDALEDTQFFPGCWECPKCGYLEQRKILCVKTGTSGGDPTVGDFACPNDGTLMVRLSLRKAFDNLSKNAEGYLKALRGVQKDLDDARELLRQAREMFPNRDGLP